MSVAVTSHRRRREAGFTLVELLVVLAVMGLLAGVALWRWPASDQRARSDAAALATRIAAARNQAILSARPVALVIDPGGYRFEARQRGQWLAIAEPALRERRWRDGVRAATDGGRRLGFDSVGLPDGTIRIKLRAGTGQAAVEVGEDGAVTVS